jgi:hypothetical protein
VWKNRWHDAARAQAYCQGIHTRMRFIGLSTCLAWLAPLALIGGEPEGIPPRPGTPEYKAWQAKRAQNAAAIKGKSQLGNSTEPSAGRGQ